MNQRILVPLDGSKHAENALSLACTLASLSDAEITMLCVMEYPLDVYSNFDSDSFADPSQDEKVKANKEIFLNTVKDYLEHLASHIDIDRRKISFEIQEGPVVDAILRTTEKLKINLIVMSTIGNDQNVWMIGSIASRILREAHVSVIMMRDGPGSSVPNRSSTQKTSLKKRKENHYAYSR